MPKGKKRAGDYRYLWKRGNRFWVQVAVPAALQERLGKKAIQISLRTSDVNEARRLRWSHVHSIKDTFERALSNEDMTADEIERIAQAEYERLAAVERLDIDGDIDSTLAETIAQLAEELEHGDEAVALPGGEVVTPGDPVIDKIEKETGIILNTEKRRELKTAFIRAQINAFDAILKRRRGLEADPVPMFNKASNATRVITARPSRGIQFVDAMAEYLAIKSPTWAYKTRSVFETSLRLFCDHIGPDKPLSEISRLDISAWREKMRRLHPRWASSVNSKGLPLDDLLATYGQGTETLSDKTLSRHMSALHGLFAWALDTGHIDKANPATVSGGKSTPRHKRGVFTDKEVCEIFEGLKFETKPRKHTHQNAMPWIAALGAFSGARLESICSLKVSDVHQEGDVWFLDIQDDKTPAGVRRVPLHSKVIALGFLDYVQAHRGTWLWPSLGNPGKGGRRGVYMGKLFAAHCRDRGLDKPLLGYHYWRKTVLTKLENAKVPEIEAARLVGHKIKTMSYGVYSGGMDLSELSATVERIGYEGLELGVNK